MNMNTLYKVPERVRWRIRWLWKSVYVTKTVKREIALAEMHGLVLGVMWMAQVSDYPEDFTGDDCQRVRDYYAKWFSL